MCGPYQIQFGFVQQHAMAVPMLKRAGTLSSLRELEEVSIADVFKCGPTVVRPKDTVIIRGLKGYNMNTFVAEFNNAGIDIDFVRFFPNHPDFPAWATVVFSNPTAASDFLGDVEAKQWTSFADCDVAFAPKQGKRHVIKKYGKLANSKKNTWTRD